MPEKGEGIQGFITRRGFIQVLAAGAAGAALGSCSPEQRALGFRPEARPHTTFITPNEEFFLVAVDPAYRPPLDPATVGGNWQLELVGLDGDIHRTRYAELEERAERVVPYTFECIGNPVGGRLIGNAEWHVLPLKAYLAQARLSTEVKSVMFEGLDDFYSSVSIERASDDYAFIALKMNGEPLPAGHGFPARVILPDLYGMKQPRWLRRITLLSDADTTSYWERRGWAGEVPVKTFSRLDPMPGLVAAKPGRLTGTAFAGARGIRGVEVSLDDGRSWLPCRLDTPSQRHVWSLWSYEWKNPPAGRYDIQVRAIDSEGQVQSAERKRSYPDGASGYHRETIAISKG
jgi:DMSO/TMAO reductase YedYZ molybdopterin-dependent catalytic subunit